VTAAGRHSATAQANPGDRIKAALPRAVGRLWAGPLRADRGRRPSEALNEVQQTSRRGAPFGAQAGSTPARRTGPKARTPLDDSSTEGRNIMLTHNTDVEIDVEDVMDAPEDFDSAAVTFDPYVV
jgi:hypothetical protein